jgi:fructoselysine and glucoselysine-specific PTS system IIA component
MEKNDRIRKFIIATHGTFAGGIKSSLDIIIGPMEHVFLIQAYADENISVEAEIKKILEQINDQDELVVFTDLLGGSVTNQVIQNALKPNVHIVAGFNLPLIIDVLLAGNDTPLDEVINVALDNAKEQMVYVNKLLTLQKEENQND